MTKEKFKSYDDLPLFLSVNDIASALGISKTSAYELVHEPDFPTVKIKGRITVPKDKFIQWIEDQIK